MLRLTHPLYLLIILSVGMYINNGLADVSSADNDNEDKPVLTEIEKENKLRKIDVLEKAPPQERVRKRDPNDNIEDECEYDKNGKKENNVVSEICYQFGKLDIGGKLKFFDGNIIKGLNLSLTSMHEVSANDSATRRKDDYTRIDKYNLTTSFRPGDIIGSTPITLNLEKGAQILFARHFPYNAKNRKKIRWKAITARPLTHKNIPFTSEIALKNFPIGTFVAIPTKLNIILGVGTFTNNKVIQAGIGGHVVVRGEFQVQVFRIDESKVHVRLIAVHSKGKGIGGSIKRKNTFRVFGINLIDKQINGLVEKTLFEIGLTKQKGELFLVEYTFNLADKMARKAYDNIMSSPFKFKRWQLIKGGTFQRKNINVNGEEVNVGLDVEDVLLTDLGMADDIFAEDIKNKVPKEKRRVDRKFKGQNKFSGHSKNIQLGLLNMRFGRKKSYTENFLAYSSFDEEGNETKEYLVYATNQERKERKDRWFGLFKKKEVSTTYILLDANADGTVSKNGLRDFGITFSYNDKIFRASEQRIIQNLITKNIGDTINDEINWKNYVTKKRQHNAGIEAQIIVNSEVLSELREKLTQMQEKAGNDNKKLVKNLTKRFDAYAEKFFLGFQKNFIIDELLDKCPKNDNFAFKRCKKDAYIFAVMHKNKYDEKNNEDIWAYNRKRMGKPAYNARYRHERNKIIKELLYIIRDSEETNHLHNKKRREKATAFMHLQKIPLFREGGIGMLLSLLDKENLEDKFHFKLQWKTSEVKGETISIGNKHQSQLYHTMKFIQNTINNKDSIDMEILDYDYSQAPKKTDVTHGD